MNTIVILAALATAALAGPVFPVSVSQDTLGNYKIDYKTEDASRSEHANEKNEVIGTFTFQDKEGHHHQVQYTSGLGGFRAVGDVIPKMPSLTPEVARATYEHNSRFHEVLRKLPKLIDEDNYHVEHHDFPVVDYYRPTPHYEEVVIINGVPQDTHEVAYAKKKLLEAHEEAIHRLIH